MTARRKLVLAAACGAASLLAAAPTTARAEFGSHNAVAGEPDLEADAGDLPGTIVTPHLEREIPTDTNVLWCATFQLAWNELQALNDGPVGVEPPSPVVDVLNRRVVAARDLDRSSYVAVAGLANSGTYRKIHKELDARFAGRSSPDLLRPFGRLPKGGLLAYAYLFKELPFRWEFGRFSDLLEFQGVEVESFGIRHLGDGGKNDARRSSQVAVLDYVDDDDLIVELQTKSKADRLLLAKVPPGETLAATVADVERRVESAEPTSMQRGTDLLVPVMNFDLRKRYRELEGRRLSSRSRKLDGKPLQFAAQSIRFRLDERGAVLKSEALGGFGAFATRNLVFDKPFLIVLRRKSAESPYFAMWVGNAELLIASD